VGSFSYERRGLEKYYIRETEVPKQRKRDGITQDTEDKGKAVVVEEDMGEPKIKEDMAFDSLLKDMNDLAKGQKEML